MKDCKRHSTSEKELGQQVEDLFKLFGWRFYHVLEQYHYAKRTSKGFPDYVATRQGNDGIGRLLFIELKNEKGLVTEAQRAWLIDLSECPGIEVYLWRPADWDEILLTLR